MIFFSKKSALKFAFSHQGKPKNFNGLSQVFIDSEGRRYFKYDDDLQTPFMRISALKICLRELNSGMPGDDFKEFLDKMEGELMSLTAPKKGEVPGASRIGWLISEMRWRQKELIHIELLYKLASIVYIREDEDPAVVDSGIEKEKIEQFKKDCAAREGGTWAFFFRTPMSGYIPYSATSEEEWTEYLQTAELRLRAEKMIMSNFRSAQMSSVT